MSIHHFGKDTEREVLESIGKNVPGFMNTPTTGNTIHFLVPESSFNRWTISLLQPTLCGLPENQIKE